VEVGDPFDIANSMIKRGEEARARLGMDPNGALDVAKTGKMVGRQLNQARHVFMYVIHPCYCVN